MLLAESFINGNMSSVYPNVLTPPSSSEDSPRPVYFEASPGSSIFTSPTENTTSLSPPIRFSVQSTMYTADPNGPTVDERPRLRFIEQPIDKFRFRYRSEMAGTHGSLTGQNSDRSRKSTYPTVELLNYNKHAVIRCSIYQIAGIGKDFMPHAHRLIMKRDKEELDDPHNIKVGPEDGYKAQFHSMGIIHTAKKNLVTELVRKKKQLYAEKIARLEGHARELSIKELLEIRGSAEQESKSINLNIVCLRFDAFFICNDIWYPLCDPLYTHGINNLKSPLTGELKIVRMDHCTSHAKGDKEIFVLVERVTKKNVKIRFFELNDDDQEVWEDYGRFTDLDVHHQYAIVFKTPKFRDENISHPVKVYMELVRPSDGARSEPKEFTYVPCHDKRGGKRPRMSNYSSSGSYSWSNSIAELPEPVNNINAMGPIVPKELLQPVDMNVVQPVATSATGDTGNLSVNSVDLEKAINDMFSPDFDLLYGQWGSEYSNNLGNEIDMSHSIDNAQLKTRNILHLDAQCDESYPKAKVMKITSKLDNLTLQGVDRTAVKKELYHEDIAMAERVLLELKSFLKTTHTKEKAKKMLNYYLGATNKTNALHVFICLNRQDEVTFLMKMIFVTQNLGIVNNTDSNNCTPLHLAVSENNPTFVKFLLRCKADCSLGDVRGNTAAHLAVEENASIEVLEMVAAATKDLNATNYEGNSPLFIAVANKNVAAIKVLCRHNVDVNMRHHKDGYTALRLAIEKQYLDVLRCILSVPDMDPGVADFTGITPFSAAARKECSKEILETIQTYMMENNIEIQVKEEFDDDDEEMDDTDTEPEIKSEPSSLEELEENFREVGKFTAKCLAEVSEILNKSGNWRHLADLLGLDHLLTSGIVPMKGNVSENLLVYATEVHNDTVFQIRNFLENLDEKEAVDSIDRMARAKSNSYFSSSR